VSAEDESTTIRRETIGDLERLAGLGWPALHDEPIGRFVAGASGVYTRRANCVATSVGGAESADLMAEIDAVEAFYRGRGLAAVFKLTRASGLGLDEALARRGYTTDGETLAMTLDLGQMAQVPSRGDHVEVVAGRVPERWFEASNTHSSVKPASRPDYAALLEHCLSTQRAVLFGHIEREGAIVSVAMASVVEASVSLAQVATDPGSRGRGLAASVLRTLFFGCP